MSPSRVWCRAEPTTTTSTSSHGFPSLEAHHAGSASFSAMQSSRIQAEWKARGQASCLTCAGCISSGIPSAPGQRSGFRLSGGLMEGEGGDLGRLRLRNLPWPATTAQCGGQNALPGSSPLLPTLIARTNAGHREGQAMGELLQRKPLRLRPQIACRGSAWTARHRRRRQLPQRRRSASKLRSIELCPGRCDQLSVDHCQQTKTDAARRS